MSLTSITYPADSALEAVTRERPTLVVFLRHFGCTFCREALADIAGVRPEIAATGTPVAFVHAVPPAEADPWFVGAGLADMTRVSDPSLAHYRAFALDTASPIELVSPTVWGRGAVSAWQHGFGAQPGDLIRQLPGAFVVHGPHILAAFRHRSPADRPDYLSLIRQSASVTMR